MSKSQTAPTQDANAVLNIINQIGNCDFRTGMYAYTTGNGEPTWICYAEHNARRYFTITDAGTENPKINVLSKDQTLLKPGIDSVNPSDVDYMLTLAELTVDSFGSVHRLLGMDNIARDQKQMRQDAEVVKMKRTG